jgi:Tol biopolymer transport system component
MPASYLKRIAVLTALALCAMPASAAGQYFGRNKVQYRTFDFHVLRTDHFDLYYYPEEAEAATIVARMAERWHARLSRFFGHDLRGRQPVILYAAAAHFRQTNAIEGLIGEGTGGVTEALKRRVVLPMSGSLADTDHVLGHELVHAFQYDLTGTDPRDGPTEAAPGILAYPLWFVEGMAEYLSLGPVDAQTAMWLRDAALREKLPDVKDLDDPKYFPYRWGHAFWAYVGARYGDRAVASLIRSAANPRFDLDGLTRQLGTDPASLNADWHTAIRLAAQAAADEQPTLTSEPRVLISHDTGSGRFNVGPEVSPDGRQIAFFSERDRFSIELFLADAETGHVDRKLLTTATDPHFDSLEFLNSAGAWSPDGRQLAVTAHRGGRPVIALLDVRSGRIRRELPVPGLDDAINPSFAPDGRSIVFAGNAGGLFDLYRQQIDSGAVERLTRDAYADLEPVFTPDMQSIVFVTERFSTDLATLEPAPLRLAILDLTSHLVRPIPGFLKGKHLSPRVSADGRTVTFIADPDGVSNLYRMPVAGGPIERLTTVPTGVAGITESSPALSMSSTGRLVFSVFEADGHSVYALDPEHTVALVPPAANLQAAVLPGRSAPSGDVQRLLTDYVRGLPDSAALTPSEPYREKLTLDSVGQPVVAGRVDSFGTQVTGSMSALFSDMLGDRMLGVQGQIGGRLADLGGELVYLNRRHRWNWAATAGVWPYSIGYLTRTDTADTAVIQEVIERQTSRGGSAAAAYPFNASTRLELTGGAQALSFGRDIRTGTYSLATRQLVDVTSEHIKDGDALYLAQGSAALVHDTSYFGATGPLFGARSRVELSRTTGSLDYTTVLTDWRRYFMPAAPVTVAVRAMHFGRYGRDAEFDRLIPLYAGYQEFVHGYGVGSFSAAECLTGAPGAECDVFDNLIGSRLAVANLEVRAPLLGILTGQLEYGRIPIDLAMFADAGVAWTADTTPAFLGGTRRVVRSVGGAARINVFGLLAVEIAASHPFDRVERGIQWQVGIQQGF